MHPNAAILTQITSQLPQLHINFSTFIIVNKPQFPGGKPLISYILQKKYFSKKKR
jgi:hypothetical protein